MEAPEFGQLNPHELWLSCRALIIIYYVNTTNTTSENIVLDLHLETSIREYHIYAAYLQYVSIKIYICDGTRHYPAELLV